jgi:hypothetical protein
MIDPRNANPNPDNTSKGRLILPLLLFPADFRAFDAIRKARWPLVMPRLVVRQEADHNP